MQFIIRFTREFTDLTTDVGKRKDLAAKLISKAFQLPIPPSSFRIESLYDTEITITPKNQDVEDRLYEQSQKYQFCENHYCIPHRLHHIAECKLDIQGPEPTISGYSYQTGRTIRHLTETMNQINRTKNLKIQILSILHQEGNCQCFYHFEQTLKQSTYYYDLRQIQDLHDDCYIESISHIIEEENPS